MQFRDNSVSGQWMHWAYFLTKSDSTWKKKLPLPQGVGLLPVGPRKAFYFPYTTYWNQQRHSPIRNLETLPLGVTGSPEGKSFPHQESSPGLLIIKPPSQVS
ncbi:hypothetical protein AVEN_101688-1 [Araneus ventricosus]|uniref:Uncharacterized protein n=1 Tax=Araneus ventricosus TaxID=182803 RepID=A0A4Y2NUJ9_ARAVE|nr:hypothetical protein AVEN_101688-1 [Araneus ventricosus]